MRHLLLAAASAAVLFPSLAMAEDAGVLCDRLAASWRDPARTAAPVAFDAVDSTAAIAACEAAAEAHPGEARYVFQLGRALAVAEDYERAEAALNEAALLGYPIAYQVLGMLHGGVMVEDHARARGYYERALAGGFAGAAADIGSLYYDGAGVDRDIARAAEFYRTAAEAGDPYGQGQYAAMLFDEEITPDYPEALRLFALAAEAGDAWAAERLGFAHYYGVGTEPDAARALAFYEEAAAGGDLWASAALSAMNFAGRGTTADAAEARRRADEVLAADDPYLAEVLAWHWALAEVNLEEADALMAARLAGAVEAGERPGALDTAALVALRRGDAARALPLQQEAVALDPSQAVYFDHLGDIHAALGEMDAAREAWSAALDMPATPRSYAPDFDPAAIRGQLTAS